MLFNYEVLTSRGFEKLPEIGVNELLEYLILQTRLIQNQSIRWNEHFVKWDELVSRTMAH